jgi:hypothetical protein
MAAHRTKVAAPNSFKEFVESIATLSAQRNAECVQASADGVLKAQGRALQLQELLDLLSNCTEVAQALHSKMKPKEKT